MPPPGSQLDPPNRHKQMPSPLNLLSDVHLHSRTPKCRHLVILLASDLLSKVTSLEPQSFSAVGVDRYPRPQHLATEPSQAVKLPNHAWLRLRSTIAAHRVELCLRTLIKYLRRMNTSFRGNSLKVQRVQVSGCHCLCKIHQSHRLRIRRCLTPPCNYRLTTNRYLAGEPKQANIPQRALSLQGSLQEHRALPW
jgi:hypothetical protein